MTGERAAEKGAELRRWANFVGLRLAGIQEAHPDKLVLVAVAVVAVDGNDPDGSVGFLYGNREQSFTRSVLEVIHNAEMPVHEGIEVEVPEPPRVEHE